MLGRASVCRVLVSIKIRDTASEWCFRCFSFPSLAILCSQSCLSALACKYCTNIDHITASSLCAIEFLSPSITVCLASAKFRCISCLACAKFRSVSTCFVSTCLDGGRVFQRESMLRSFCSPFICLWCE